MEKKILYKRNKGGVLNTIKYVGEDVERTMMIMMKKNTRKQKINGHKHEFLWFLCYYVGIYIHCDMNTHKRYTHYM